MGIARSCRRLSFAFVAVAALLTAAARPARGDDRTVDPPEDHWTFPASVPRIHIARGLWWDFWRIHEGGAMMGGARYSASHDVRGSPTGYHGTGRPLAEFPDTYEKMFGHNVIVLAGVRADVLNNATQTRLKHWVERGGGLLVLGSIHTFARGGYQGTVLESILPVSIGKGSDLREASSDAVLAPTASAETFFTRAVPWQQTPRVLFYHDGLVPRDDASVRIKAEGHPMLVTRELGKGRVAVFTGTVCGEAAPNELAMWEWDGWPMVMADVLAWLADTPAPKAEAGEVYRATAAYKQKLAALRDLAAPDFDTLLEDDTKLGDATTESDVAAQLVTLAQGCRDATYAHAVVKAATESMTTFDVASAEAIYRAIEPYVMKDDCTSLALRLARSGDPGRAALGVRLVGRLRVTDGANVALQLFRRGAIDMESAETETGAALDRSNIPNGDHERLQLAAVRAIADFGDRDLLGPLRDAGEVALPRNPDEAGTPTLIQIQRDLVEQTAATRCLLGDGEAAVALVDTLVENSLRIEYDLDVLERRMYYPNPTQIREKKQAALELPLLRARNVRLESVLMRFPSTGYPALAVAADTWGGPFAGVYLQACLAGDGELDSTSGAALRRIVMVCPLREVRVLCAERLRRAGDDRLIASITELASGDKEAALFAMGQVALMPGAARSAVVKAGLGHPDAHVRRMAHHAIELVPLGDQAAMRELAEDPER